MEAKIEKINEFLQFHAIHWISIHFTFIACTYSKCGSYDVYGKDSIIDWKKQIVNIPSQNNNTNPIKEGSNKEGK